MINWVLQIFLLLYINTEAEDEYKYSHDNNLTYSTLTFYITCIPFLLIQVQKVYYYLFTNEIE
jgi:hypothetical protein